jgi:hypothetical protein
MNRDYKNVHHDLQLLERVGLVTRSPAPTPAWNTPGRTLQSVASECRDGKHALPRLAPEWEAAYRPVALLLKSSPMDKVERRHGRRIALRESDPDTATSYRPSSRSGIGLTFSLTVQPRVLKFSRDIGDNCPVSQIVRRDPARSVRWAKVDTSAVHDT